MPLHFLVHFSRDIFSTDIKHRRYPANKSQSSNSLHDLIRISKMTLLEQCKSGVTAVQNFRIGKIYYICFYIHDYLFVSSYQICAKSENQKIVLNYLEVVYLCSVQVVSARISFMNKQNI
ncbi:hypothetical protein T4D_595 [Trichinella pseudospiralis]|uniref:Uncharacterized protein n=1 Tax=Trichinella pseudospiralis TaxID=6337 RepID=A0A0V1FDS8_TRIPS|nr:hypothetical protein T4D_595 [Trichinella pseudospiralis]